MRIQYLIVFVSDMRRSIAFYRDVLELPLKFESPPWSEFLTEGATLALHLCESADPHCDDPECVPAGRARLGLRVPSLDAFHQRMIEHKVRCFQAPTEIFGTRIAQYVDPDGLGFSVSDERAGGSGKA